MDEKEVIEILKEREKVKPFFILLLMLSGFLFFFLAYMAMELISQLEQFKSLDNALIKNLLLYGTFLLISFSYMTYIIPIANRLFRCPNCKKSVLNSRYFTWGTHCPNCKIKIRESDG